MPAVSCAFESAIFLSVTLCESRCMFDWRHSSSYSNYFFMVFIHLAFLLRFLCSCLTPNFFFFCLQFMLYLCSLVSNLLIECPLVFLDSHVSFVLFDPVMLQVVVLVVLVVLKCVTTTTTTTTVVVTHFWMKNSIWCEKWSRTGLKE